MYDSIQALEALRDLGTMGQAAARLRITQSAVSKRIAALEESLGVELIEKSGRRVRLTSEGRDFLGKAEPLVRDLNSLLHTYEGKTTASAQRGKIVLGVTESILSAWGAAVLQSALKRLPGMELELHSHRSHLVIEHVRSGDYMLGLCTDPLNDQSLASELLIEEPLVIIPSGLKSIPLKRGSELSVISVEENSATWGVVQRKVRRQSIEPQYRLKWAARVESFSAVVQMARAGFGHGVAPIGIARAMGVPASKWIPLGRDFRRPISWVGRPSILSRPMIREFIGAVKTVLPERAFE